jgi:branched-chain amino acid transport system permease protein
MEALGFFLQTLVDGLLLSGGYILVAVGLALIFGVLDYVNVAHAEFAMLGMYIAYWVWRLVGLDPYFALLVTVPFMCAVGFLFYRVMVRPLRGRTHGAHILITLGLAFILQNVALLLFSADVRSVDTAYSRSLSLGPVSISLPKLMAFAFAMLMVAGLIIFLNRTKLGRAIRSVAQDESLAAAFGVNIDRVFTITVAIALAMAGAAGTIMITYLSVEPIIGQRFILIAFAIIVLGGMGSIKGALVAGILVGMVEALGQVYLGGLMGQVLVFSMIILVLYLRPSGLFGRAML